MNKLIVIVLICCFAILTVSAKRSKQSFIEQIVELADTERGGSFRMPTIAPMSFRMPTVSSFAPRMPSIGPIAPKMPTFTSFAPTYRMPSFSTSFTSHSFAPMRMPSFASPKFPSFTPMRMPSFNSPRFPSYAPARLPAFASHRMPMPSFRPSTFAAPSRIGHGRVNLVNYANRFNTNRNPFGSLPAARNAFGSKPLGHGRAALRNYANRFNGRNPFGSLTTQRNQQGRLPYFANPRNQQFGGKAFNPIGRNSRLPTFARQRNSNFIPTRSLPTVSNRGNRGNSLRNAPTKGANPNARQAQPKGKASPANRSGKNRDLNNAEPSHKLGGRAKSKPKLDYAMLNRAFNRLMKSKEGKAIKSIYESLKEPVDRVNKFINPHSLSNYKIDKDFLEKVEGNILEANVPNSGHSGVTVATGFDLGQRTRGDLQALGLPKKLIDKLSPYLGKKLGNAQALIDQNPLIITKDEARAIDTATMYNGVKKLVKDYESSASKYPGSIKRFSDLPKEVQTVAYSVEHQYGDSKSKTPQFFDQLARNDYKGMVNNLRNFKDDYTSRRNKEADFIQQHIGKK